MEVSARTTMFLLSAWLGLAPLPGIANDGGGGNETQVPATGPKKSKPGECDRLVKAAGAYADLADQVQSVRISLRRQRDELADMKSQVGSFSRRQKTQQVADTTAELERLIDRRNAAKREYDRLKRGCS